MEVRIGDAAEMLGVSVDTLRRWEREKQLRTVRTAGGQRAIPLAVAGAYHSPLMASAQPKLQAELATAKISAPSSGASFKTSGKRPRARSEGRGDGGSVWPVDGASGCGVAEGGDMRAAPTGGRAAVWIIVTNACGVKARERFSPPRRRGADRPQ